MSDLREALGKRAIPCGTLRPAITLYNEAHPHGELLGKIQTIDLKRRPDVLVVLGTSLKVIGIKKFVKEAAKMIIAKNGRVFYVNRTELPSKEWDNVFDLQLIGDSDEWATLINRAIDSQPRPLRDRVLTPILESKSSKTTLEISPSVKPEPKTSPVSPLRQTVLPFRKIGNVFRAGREEKQVKNGGRALS